MTVNLAVTCDDAACGVTPSALVGSSVDAVGSGAG